MSADSRLRRKERLDIFGLQSEGNEGARSLRLGNWKLVVTGEGDQRKVELFDIGADSEEANNLALQHPQRLQGMLKQLDNASKADRDAVAQQ